MRSPERSTKVLRPDQLSPDTQKNLTVQYMLSQGYPLTRSNFIRLAGLSEELGDYVDIPPEFQKEQ